MTCLIRDASADFMRSPHHRREQGSAPVRANAWRVAGMMLFALLLAGCDSCGDFVSPIGHACRQEAPRPH
jgi:hypothetical protein